MPEANVSSPRSHPAPRSYMVSKGDFLAALEAEGRRSTAQLFTFICVGLTLGCLLGVFMDQPLFALVARVAVIVAGVVLGVWYGLKWRRLSLEAEAAWLRLLEHPIIPEL